MRFFITVRDYLNVCQPGGPVFDPHLRYVCLPVWCFILLQNHQQILKSDRLEGSMREEEDMFMKVISQPCYTVRQNWRQFQYAVRKTNNLNRLLVELCDLAFDKSACRGPFYVEPHISVRKEVKDLPT